MTEAKKTVKKAAKPAAKKTVEKKTSVAIRPEMYDIITSPIVTEKSQLGAEANKVTFQVASGSCKSNIKKAVEAIFGVKVTKVNIINVKGKLKRFRGHEGRRNDVKKAVVTLAEGNTIDVTAGI